MDRIVTDERSARMALACVSEPGDKDLADLVAAEGAQAVWHSLAGRRQESRWGRRLVRVRLGEVLAMMQRRSLRFVVPGDEEWPDRLDDLAEVEHDRIHARPLGLWVAGPGHLAQWADSSVAIVGTRTASRYGETVATELAAGLAEQGTTVVSGGAYGIDICAHRGVLAVRGATIAVFAGGLNEPYPAGNSRVFAEIGQRGLLVSELPPGERPSRPRFLGRNRLIAGLTAGSVMVEARLRSGAKNTLNWAESLGRHRMAVPGPISSVYSEGPHHQIQRGASLVTSAAEIQELIAPAGQAMLPLTQGPRRVLDGLSETLREVFEVVPGRGGLAAEEIAGRTGRGLLDTIAALGELEERGLVESNPYGAWRLRAGASGWAR